MLADMRQLHHKRKFIRRNIKPFGDSHSTIHLLRQIIPQMLNGKRIADILHIVKMHFNIYPESILG